MRSDLPLVGTQGKADGQQGRKQDEACGTRRTEQRRRRDEGTKDREEGRAKENGHFQEGFKGSPRPVPSDL